ncbi:DUF4293 domain-containing protein [Massilibacteroides sp.]|uniref:DUF4293 domain-containing protein n=1 Tax=Massilibacteroides sp. TaxID=2034766 RepID=UPI00260EDE30|nr:DUF4293 domain-containing protein [Massilibacteroides sp.]MDD4516670.1 DUF4293 domain-containing protein [Massilibacteroides sp.]
MLQRIQTVYLLLVAILMLIVVFFPLAVVQSGNTLYSFDVFGLNTLLGEKELIYPVRGLFVLVVVILAVAMTTIFLFKKRLLQIRLTIFNTILLLGFYGLFAYLIYLFKGELSDFSYSLKFAASFPAVCIVLNYLAIRNIGADEALVRSLDRLR